MKPRGKPAAKPAYKRWDKESEAAAYLQRGLESGDIDPNLPPHKVYETHTIFHQYKLESFRNALRNAKENLGINSRDDGPGSMYDEFLKYGAEGKYH